MDINIGLSSSSLDENSLRRGVRLEQIRIEHVFDGMNSMIYLKKSRGLVLIVFILSLSTVNCILSSSSSSDRNIYVRMKRG